MQRKLTQITFYHFKVNPFNFLNGFFIGEVFPAKLNTGEIGALLTAEFKDKCEK